MNSFMENLEGRRVFLPPIDEAKLKYFAVVTMLIDHAACAFLENAYTADGTPLCYSFSGGMLLDKILRAIGRQAFPIFCFFLVEGFFHTRSKPKYFLRLVIFALISQFPFQKCVFPRTESLRPNVIFTLAIGFLAIWIIDEMWKIFMSDWAEKFFAKATDQKDEAERDAGQTADAEESESGIFASPLVRAAIFLIISVSVVIGFGSLAKEIHTDYRYGGVIVIIIMYCLRKYRFMSLFVSWIWLSWYNSTEIYSLPAFMMLACYNGERGKQNKYFFYFFYPVHLLLIWLVRRSVFGS